jgi:methionine aminopeptidase
MDDEILSKYRKAGKIASAARDFGASKVKEGALLLDIA